MECIAEPAADRGPPDTVAAAASSGASATLCMNCEVRASCLGSIAAEAGTAQLKGILAGRVALQVREVLQQPGDRFATVYAVRSGALMSATGGEDGRRVVGFHFPGELLGADCLVAGRQRVTVSAMADSQLCALRFAPSGNEAPGARAILARLWDMMSCELVRGRAHHAMLAALPSGKRVTAFFAGMRARLRSRSPLRLPPAMGAREIASYLGVAPELVEAEPLRP